MDLLSFLQHRWKQVSLQCTFKQAPTFINNHSRTLIITALNKFEGEKTNEIGEANKALARVYVSVGLENIVNKI